MIFFIDLAIGQHDVCDAIIPHAHTATVDDRIEIDRFDIDFINEKWIGMRNKRAIAAPIRRLQTVTAVSIHKIVLHTRITRHQHIGWHWPE